MSSGKVLVAQGGGPTAVINQSLVGVVLEARRHHNVRRSTARATACAASSTRTSSTSPRRPATTSNWWPARRPRRWAPRATSPTAPYCQEIFKVLQAHEIEHFFYIGGNDSSDTVRIVSEEAHKAGYPLRCIHIPKTIDNDLVGNDHTPGFPSAARFVAQAFAGANLDNARCPASTSAW